MHAILHRMEGSIEGEANLSGYRNAEYWYGNAGDDHPLLHQLGDIARSTGVRYYNQSAATFYGDLWGHSERDLRSMGLL